jgi:GntR family transcriptional regulator
MCHSTPVIPFRVVLESGKALHEQVAFAARKAVISGQMRAGDPFPSVRTLSKACRINPNTAHKVIAQLTAEGFLQVIPGIGTVVAVPPDGAPADRLRLLDRESEQLVVEARRLGLSLREVQAAVAAHWRNLEPELKR